VSGISVGAFLVMPHPRLRAPDTGQHGIVGA
jgi:hypothetical protein